MRFLIRFIFILLLLLPAVFCTVSLAQDKTSDVQERPQTETVLTNKDVVALIKAGFSEEIIFARIKNSKRNFDVSTDALTELKSA